jgi:hypothetical protein
MSKVIVDMGMSMDGFVDEMQIHLAQCCSATGSGCSKGSIPGVALERERVMDSPKVTHLGYRVVKQKRRENSS